MASANRDPRQVALPQLEAVNGVGRIGGPAPQASAQPLAAAAAQGDGLDQYYRQAAAVFQNVANHISTIGDHAAKVEGERAGALAGLDPEFRPTGSMTIRGEAFDKAAVHTYQAQLSTELIGKMESAYLANPNDPAALKGTLEKIKAGYESRVFPEVLPEFQQQYARHSIGLMREATRGAMLQAHHEQAASLQENLTARMRQIEQAGYRNGLDPTGSQALAGDLADMRRQISAKDARGNYLIAPETQAKLLRDTEDQAVRAQFSGAFKRLGSLEEKDNFLKEIEARYLKGDDPVLNRLDPRQYESLVGHLRSEAKREDLMSSQVLRQTERDLKAIETAAAQGVRFTDAELAPIQSSVLMAARNKPELLDRFNEAKQTLQAVQAFNVTRPAELEAAVTAERARLSQGGAVKSENELARLQLGEKYLERLHKALATDQLGWASRAGVARIDALDVGDAARLTAGLRARGAAAEQVAAFYQRDVHYFRPEERAALTAKARFGGQAMLEVAGAITQGLGDAAPKAFAEIAKDMPELAHIGRMMVDGASPAAIDDAAKAQELKRDKNFQPLLKTNDTTRAVVETKVAQAFAAMPNAIDAGVQTANAIYEVRARRLGKQAYDAKLYEEAVQDAFGRVTVGDVGYGGIGNDGAGWTRWGGRPIVIPAGVRNDGFGDLVKTLRAEDLAAIGTPYARGADGKLTPLAVADMRKATWVAVGGGRYALALGDDLQKDPQYIAADPARPQSRGKNGELIVDLGGLLPTLRQRRPDLFLGGAR